MTRLALAFSIAALLLISAIAGWIGHWAVSRGRRGSEALERRLAETAARLHAVEAQRDGLARRAEAAEAALDEEKAGAERRLVAALAESKAELRAAMESIGDARREAAEWRAAYDAVVREDREDP